MATALRRRNIVVIGGSAGAIDGLRRLVAGLPADLTAALFVVIHIPATSVSSLPQILSRAGPLPAAHAKDGDPIAHGRIVIAPPDHHLLISGERVHLSRGPREHGHRPSADALFRSAARHHDGQVIGVVLSGMLGDGALGLARIVAQGGVGIVQDPDDAAYSPMPKRAVALAKPQHIVPLDDIAPLIVQTVRTEAPAADATVAVAAAADSDEQLVHHATSVGDVNSRNVEHEQMEEDVAGGRPLGDDVPGRPSGYSCPDCGGVLWERGDGDSLEIVCRIGHLYNLNSLFEAKDSALEGALWAGVRALEEQASLLRRLAALQHHGGASEEQLLAQASDRDRQVRMLRGLLESRS